MLELECCNAAQLVRRHLCLSEPYRGSDLPFRANNGYFSTRAFFPIILVVAAEAKQRRVVVFRLWVLVTSTTPLKVYLFDGGVVIFGSVNKPRTALDLPADDEVRMQVQDHQGSSGLAGLQPGTYDQPHLLCMSSFCSIALCNRFTRHHLCRSTL